MEMGRFLLLVLVIAAAESRHLKTRRGPSPTSPTSPKSPSPTSPKSPSPTSWPILWSDDVDSNTEYPPSGEIADSDLSAGDGADSDFPFDSAADSASYGADSDLSSGDSAGSDWPFDSADSDLSSADSADSDLSSADSADSDLSSADSADSDLSSVDSADSDLSFADSADSDLSAVDSADSDFSSGNYTNDDFSSGIGSGDDLSSGNYTDDDFSSGIGSGDDLSSGNYTDDNLSSGNFTGDDLSSGSGAGINLRSHSAAADGHVDSECDDCSLNRAKILMRHVDDFALHNFMKRARSLHSAANRAVMRALKDTRQLGVANVSQLVPLLQRLFGDLQALDHQAVELMKDTNIMVARTYIVGFENEDRCAVKPHTGRKPHPKCKTEVNYKRRMYQRKADFIVCLFDNIGDMVKSVMIGYAEVEQRVEMGPGPKSCRHVAAELERVRGSRTEMNINDTVDVLKSFLRYDLQCVAKFLYIFETLLRNTSLEDPSRDFIRRRLVNALALLEMIYEEAVQTFGPIVHAMHRLQAETATTPVPSVVCDPGWQPGDAGDCIKIVNKRRAMIERLLKYLEI